MNPIRYIVLAVISFCFGTFMLSVLILDVFPDFVNNSINSATIVTGQVHDTIIVPDTVFSNKPESTIISVFFKSNETYLSNIQQKRIKKAIDQLTCNNFKLNS